MKTKRWMSALLCLLLCVGMSPLFALADGERYLEINETNFPDANFRQWVITNLAGGKDYMTEAEVDGVEVMDVSDRGIADMKGIEHFSMLKRLYCSQNQLVDLDVSHNTALELLWCLDNRLVSLDTSRNTELESLQCSGNQLTTLDVSHNPALIMLTCEQNQLTTLDVCKNTVLEGLYCYENQLTALDVSSNAALTVLHCGANELTALDVSKNTALTELQCYTNQLTALDVSSNVALVALHCGSNKLTGIDVSRNTVLEMLYCGSNQLTTLDVSKNTALKELHCESNRLTALDVGENTALTELYCGSNQLTALDVSANTALTCLDCYDNQLTALDVSGNAALESMTCGQNQLAVLDVSQNASLKDLECYSNRLASLDLSKNAALTECGMWGQQLPTQELMKAGNSFTCDLGALLIDPAKVTVTTAGVTYHSTTGVFTMAEPLESFAYEYDTGYGAMDVTVSTKYKASTTPPTIKTQPKDVKVKSGSKAKFTVKAKEKNVSFQWFCRIGPADDWFEMEGETKATLTFVSTMVKDGSQYYCRVSNADGYVDSRIASLTVTPQVPVIKTQPKSVKVKNGAKAKFSIKASGPDLAYRWFSRPDSFSQWTELPGETQAVLNVVGTMDKNGYQYCCEVSNDDGAEASKVVTLTVISQAPTIKTQPKSITLKSGSKGKFTVKASGKNLSYKWFSRPNADAEWTEIAGETKATLNIVGSMDKNGWEFCCEVQNPDGKVRSNPAKLTVTPQAPKISTQPKDVKAKVGAKATFKVKASPKNVTYQWYYRTSETGEWIKIEGATSASYSFKVAEAQFGYQYRCLVRNADGEAWSKVATLIRK